MRIVFVLTYLAIGALTSAEAERGRAIQVTKPTQVAPSRTNSNDASDGVGEQANVSTKPSEASPTRHPF